MNLGKLTYSHHCCHSHYLLHKHHISTPHRESEIRKMLFDVVNQGSHDASFESNAILYFYQEHLYKFELIKSIGWTNFNCFFYFLTD